MGEKSWNRWFKRFFSFVEDNNVKIICYINSDWESLPMFKGQGWGDGRVQNHPLIKEKWLKEVKKSKYLKASPKLFQLLGYNRN